MTHQRRADNSFALHSRVDVAGIDARRRAQGYLRARRPHSLEGPLKI